MADEQEVDLDALRASNAERLKKLSGGGVQINFTATPFDLTMTLIEMLVGPQGSSEYHRFEVAYELRMAMVIGAAESQVDRARLLAATPATNGGLHVVGGK